MAVVAKCCGNSHTQFNWGRAASRVRVAAVLTRSVRAAILAAVLRVRLAAAPLTQADSNCSLVDLG